jgi:hypothetical protein
MVLSSLSRATCVAIATYLFSPPFALAQPQHYQPPPFPLFRCDGQRAPVFGADDCANWRLQKKQERLIDLQIKELERRQRANSAGKTLPVSGVAPCPAR